MKKIIALAIVALLTGFATSPNYYIDGQEIVGNGFVFKCTEEAGWITIYDQNMPYPEIRQIYKDGTQVRTNAPRPSENAAEQMSVVARIIISFLTPAKKNGDPQCRKPLPLYGICEYRYR